MEEVRESAAKGSVETSPKESADLIPSTQKSQCFGYQPSDLERHMRELKRLLEEIRSHIWVKPVPLEGQLVIGIVAATVLCLIGMLSAAYFFRDFLVTIANTKPILWSPPQVWDKAVTLYSGQTTLATGLPGTSLAWAAGLGFVALVVAMAIVAVSASVALSRIGRE